jgi:hypothetical protein
MILFFYGVATAIPDCEIFCVHNYKTFKLQNYDMFLVISHPGNLLQT